MDLAEEETALDELDRLVEESVARDAPVRDLETQMGDESRRKQRDGAPAVSISAEADGESPEVLLTSEFTLPDGEALPNLDGCNGAAGPLIEPSVMPAPNRIGADDAALIREAPGYLSLRLSVLSLMDAPGGPWWVVRKSGLRNVRASFVTRSSVARPGVLYDPEFLAAIEERDTSHFWAIVFVLLHEVGHHKLGHTHPDETWSTQEEEKLADAYAGYLMSHFLCTTAEEIAQGVAAIPSGGDHGLLTERVTRAQRGRQRNLETHPDEGERAACAHAIRYSLRRLRSQAVRDGVDLRLDEFQEILL